MERWLLPEGVEEALPPDTWGVEAARRTALDMFRAWGYELIRPPLIEFLESLLTGTGRDLDLQTFKLTDQLSGRLMGVRCDMTTQAARIDAHRLPRDVPARYCYLGSVLRTRPDSPGGTRTPLQIGAELFGYPGIAGDAEIMALMLETLNACGISEVHVDLGHVGIYRSLAAQAGLDDQDEWQLFDILQRKAMPDLRQFVGERQIAAPLADMLCALPELSGDITTIDEARQRLKAAGSEVEAGLGDLAKLASEVQARYVNVPLHIDLAELRGYRYKTGVVFAAFQSGQGRELARGGRYDNIGREFGHARAATGFSADLNRLCQLGQRSSEGARKVVFAPAVDDPALQDEIQSLRRGGCQVLAELPGQTGDAAGMNCTHSLVQQDGVWRVQRIDPAT